MHARDLWHAAIGALKFTAVWIVMSLFFSSSPAYANAIAGGIAWFVGILVFRNQVRRTSQE